MLLCCDTAKKRRAEKTERESESERNIRTVGEKRKRFMLWRTKQAALFIQDKHLLLFSTDKSQKFNRSAIHRNEQRQIK